MRREHFYKSMPAYSNSRLWQDVYHVPSAVGLLYVKFTADTVTESLLLSFKGKIKEAVAMLTAIHAQEDRKEAQKKAEAVVKKLQEMKLGRAADKLSDGVPETLGYYGFPREHWRTIRTNNPLERIMKEIRRRTRVVGSFPDGRSALMLVAARLRHIAGTKWGMSQYLKMDRLEEAVTENMQT